MKNMRALAGLLAILTLTMLQITAVTGASTKITAGQNFLVTTDPRNQPQVEPSIAVDPRNPDIIVAGANDMRLFEGIFLPSGWAGFYRSTDAGKTWTNTLIPGFPGDNSPKGMASPLRGFQFFFDSVLRFDSHGNLFYGGIVFTENTATIFNGTYFVAKFINDGATFKSIAIVQRGSGMAPFADKPFIFVDSANDNIYATWTNFTGASTIMAFSRSIDHGETFSRPIALSTLSLIGQQGNEHEGQFSYIAAINNIVYVSWAEDSFGPFVNDIIHRLVLVKSTDGGLHFTAPTQIVQVNDIPGTLPGNLFRAHTFPGIATDGTGAKLFVAWSDFASGNADILSVFSLDGGVTWSRPRTVNDVTTNSQFDPFVGFANGRLHIAWYDSRLGQFRNGTITALDVFYTTSSDFGQTFARSVRVTSQSFNPDLLIYINQTRAFIGDYIWVDAVGGIAQIAWTDNRDVIPGAGFNTGARNSDIFTARVTVS